MANIKLDRVRKSFGKVDVIKGVDLDIKSREFIVFVGPSGCGKSTLLRPRRRARGHHVGRAFHRQPGVKRALALGPRHRHGLSKLCALPHMTVYENMPSA